MLRVAHRVRPCSGETASGDAALVRTVGDRTMFAVIDVLGHGATAADAAAVAAKCLRAADDLGSVEALLAAVDDGLRSMRGAAALLCILRGRHVESAGVGNVQMRVLGSAFRAVCTPGILGQRRRRLRVFRGELDPGTRLVMFSDGIDEKFPDALALDGDPDAVCDRILDRYGRTSDDATVLTAEIP
jgi:phosphoserine phosphatase RsbX